MELAYFHSKVRSPVPTIFGTGIGFTILSSIVFRMHFESLAKAIALAAILSAAVWFLGFLTMSDSKPLRGKPWTPKVVRNYNRSASHIRRTFAITLGSCLVFIVAGIIAETGADSAAVLVGLFAIGIFGFAMFSYLQGPLEPYEYGVDILP